MRTVRGGIQDSTLCHRRKSHVPEMLQDVSSYGDGTEGSKRSRLSYVSERRNISSKDAMRKMLFNELPPVWAF